jgi:hypothetical protein
MARTLDQWLAALRKLELPAGLDTLRDALALERVGTGARAARGVGVVIAAAARLVAEHRVEVLVPELVDAFERLASGGAERDPGCRGKIAIARALHALDVWEERVFVAGLHVIQLEGPMSETGERDDTAAELRGVCGLAHAHFARSDALDVLAELLLDPQRTTRLAAAQGLGDAGRPDASALLRYVVLRDEEEEPEVLGPCFDALLTLAPQASSTFCIRMLDVKDARSEAAAVALGAARSEQARAPLVAWCERVAAEQRHRVGYVALALLRNDAANGYLVGRIRSGSRADAVAAARALATFKDDPAIAELLRDAARDAGDPAVARVVDDALRGAGV